MSLRVIAGEFRGRKLALPRGADIRPTADRVREALFASLGAAVRDAEVADLCAGTGALGIEALSRGAASAVFVERDARVRASLRLNLDALGLGERAVVVAADAVSWLRSQATAGLSFDLLIADPPYASDILARLSECLYEHPDLVRPGGVVVFEAGAEDMPTPPLNEFACRYRRAYGTACVAMFDRVGDAGNERD